MAGGYISLSFGTATSSGTNNNTYNVPVTLYYYGNGISYNNDSCDYYIWKDGTTDWKTQKGTSSFGTSTSAQTLGTITLKFTKGISAQTVTIKGEFDTNVSLGNLTTTKDLTIPAGNYTWHVKYNTNGGTTVSTQDVTTGATFTVGNGTTPSKTGYSFDSNNSWIDPTGARWPHGNTYTWKYTNGVWGINNNTLTLKANWTPITYSITFHSNPPTENDTDVTIQQTGFVYDSPKQLNANTWSFTGYNFKGWNRNSDDSGQSYGNLESVKNLTTTYNGPVHLYAIWIPEQTNTTLNKAEIRRIISPTKTSESLSGEAIQLIIDWTRGKTATTVHNVTYQLEGDIIQNETPLTTGSETQGVKNIIQTQAFGVGGTVTLTIRDYGTQTIESGTTPLKTITKELQIPTGGYPVHINSEGTAIQFFGLASSSDNGVYSPSMTPDEINNFLQNLNQNFRGSVDWIVEQGASGMWIYRKWASGIAECWGRYTASNISISAAWGTEKNAYSTSLGSLTYPFTFIDTPISQITDATSSGRGWFIRNSDNESNSSTGTIYIIAPTQYTGTNAISTVTINIYAIGRWQ